MEERRFGDVSAGELKTWAERLETQLRTRPAKKVEVNKLIPRVVADHFWAYDAPDDAEKSGLVDNDVVTQTSVFLKVCLALKDSKEADLLERVYWTGDCYKFLCFQTQRELRPFEEWWKKADSLARREALLDLEEIIYEYHSRKAPFGAVVKMKGISVFDYGPRKQPDIKITKFSTIGSGTMLADRIALDYLVADVMTDTEIEKINNGDRAQWRQIVSTMTCVTCDVQRSIWHFSKCSCNLHASCNDCIGLMAKKRMHGRTIGSVRCPFPGSCEFSPYTVTAILTDQEFGKLVNDQLHTIRIKSQHEGAKTEAALLVRALETKGIPGAICSIASRRLSHPSCPACGEVFIDFDACAAVECIRCNVTFCGWCCAFHGDGVQVHDHVASRCAVRPRDAVGYGSHASEVTVRRLSDELVGFLNRFPQQIQLDGLRLLKAEAASHST